MPATPHKRTAPARICIVGAGGTGAEVARTLIEWGHIDIALIDIAEDMAVGKAIDLGQSGMLLGHDVRIRAGSDLDLLQDADIIVITAGRGRRPGEPRERMLADNANVVRSISQAAAAQAPHAHLILLTNPADLLTRVAHEASGFPLSRVLGQGGVLDSARLATHVARALGVSVSDVRAMVLGGHGDSMVPVPEFVTIHGVPARPLLDDATWADAVERTRRGGEEILKHFGTHGATVTPGLAVCTMIDALLSPIPRVLPISTKPSGEFGLTDVFLGLPALVSQRGVESVLEARLSPSALASLHASAEMQRKAWNEWQSLAGSG